MAVGKEQAKTAGLDNIHWVVSKAQQVGSKISRESPQAQACVCA